MKKIGILLKLLAFRMKARNKHGIHSPFVYDFVTRILKDHHYYPEYKKAERQVSMLKRNNNVLETIDFGSGRGKMGYVRRMQKVKDIVRTTGIASREGRLLYRLVAYFRPDTMLELGSSLGVSTIYQATGAPGARFISIEGCASIAAVARESLNNAGSEQVELLIGHFNTELPKALEQLGQIGYAFIDGNHTYMATVSYFKKIKQYCSDSSVLVFHDIHWSKGMEKAWEEIQSDEQVTVTIDLFFMGIVFFRRELSKQDFRIRF
jgi:predicted O-methyltransferase YrrM